MSTELLHADPPRPAFEGGQILTDQWLNKLVDWSEGAVDRAVRPGGWGIREGWCLWVSSQGGTELEISPGLLVTPAGRVVVLSELLRVKLTDLLDDTSALSKIGEHDATLWLEPVRPEPSRDRRMTYRANGPGEEALMVATTSGLALRLRPTNECSITPLKMVKENFPEEPGQKPLDELIAERRTWRDAYDGARRDFAEVGRMPLGRLRLEVTANEGDKRLLLREVVPRVDRPVWGVGLDAHEKVLTVGLLELSPAAARRQLEAEGVVVALDERIPDSGGAPWLLQVAPGAVVELFVDSKGALVGLKEIAPNLVSCLVELQDQLDEHNKQFAELQKKLGEHWRRMDALRAWALIWASIGAALVLIVVAVTYELGGSHAAIVLTVVAVLVLGMATLGRRWLIALLQYCGMTLP
jgi:hypothetical protein